MPYEQPISFFQKLESMVVPCFFSFSQGHVHRNWGFSQYGSYELAFDLKGGGAYGATAPTGSTKIGFVVAVPEPSTVALAAAGCDRRGARDRWPGLSERATATRTLAARCRNSDDRRAENGMSRGPDIQMDRLEHR
jgi:surface-anchored protein